MKYCIFILDSQTRECTLWPSSAIPVLHLPPRSHKSQITDPSLSSKHLRHTALEATCRGSMCQQQWRTLGVRGGCGCSCIGLEVRLQNHGAAGLGLGALCIQHLSADTLRSIYGRQTFLSNYVQNQNLGLMWVACACDWTGRRRACVGLYLPRPDLNHAKSHCMSPNA